MEILKKLIKDNAVVLFIVGVALIILGAAGGIEKWSIRIPELVS